MARGRLRVYLGAAPGVGKTFAMLGEGHRRLERGTDVVIAVVETHGRAHTAQLVAGIPVVARRTTTYRGATFEEMDLDAVLERAPRVALVDELAHTNVPGSQNEKRWQDVETLLAAGIDVITTVNVQHLESLGDVVTAITGVVQRETVPDSVVRAANQIELVDMSPESLRRRMAHGNIYRAEKVDAALSHYFRVGNLTALRELALLWLADRVDEGLERYRSEHEIDAIWPARERIVVALTGGPEGETLIRRAARVAGRSQGRDLAAVHIVRGDGAVGAAPEALAKHRTLVESLGGSFHTVVGDDVAQTLLEFARTANATQVVVGASRRSRVAMLLRPGTSELAVRQSGDIDVLVITHERAGRSRGTGSSQRIIGARRRRLAWLVAVLVPVVLTLLLLPFRDSLALTSVVLAYLLGLVVVALIGGLAPAVVTALIAGLLANWFFTPPVGGLTISRPENAFALVVFIFVGATVASIVDRSAARAEQAARRGAESEVLAALATGVLRREDGVRALLDQARETFAMSASALLESTKGTSSRPEVWSVIESSGVVPLTGIGDADVVVSAGPSLVLAVKGRALSPSDLRLLDAYAAQAAAVLDRSRLAVRAADAQRLREVDAVRTALLAAVSHDLRTPLAGIKVAVSSLRDESMTWSAQDEAELLETVEISADRLDALLSNLLDMSRLQTGVVKPVMVATSVPEIVARALVGIDTARVRDEVPEALPLVVTDGGLLERVVANVVENAVRHAPADVPVRVNAGLVPGTNRLEVRIVDRGPGVSEQQREAMFAPFQRLGDAPSGNGVGLGLAVARGLAEAVGAQLEVEDTPGGGLTMVVSLPVVSTVEDFATQAGDSS